MEDYGWLIFIAAVWIFSTIGEMRKAQRKRRQSERAGRDDDRAVGPAALQRDLENDLGEAARRAQVALERWEARQAKQHAPVEAPSPEPVSFRRKGPGQRARERARARAAERHRHEASRNLGIRTREIGTGFDVTEPRRAGAETRREAYDAIAGMLGGRSMPKAPVAPRAAEPLRETSIVDHELGASPRRETLAPPARGARPGVSGLARIEQLPMLQRAIVLREVLGPPKALSPESDLR